MTNRGKEPSLDLDSKYLIIHADDLGMCHSVNAAIFSAFSKDAISSASIMVPCPWFNEAAEYISLHRAYDIGVHLTLTSEWKDYKWRPVSVGEPSSGLVDEMGYFWPTRKQIVADEATIAVELSSQIMQAINAGLDVSHIDSHMFALFHNSSLLRAYSSVAQRFDLPFLYHTRLTRSSGPLNCHQGLTVIPSEIYEADLRLPAHSWAEFYLDVICSLKPGFAQLVVHPGFDDAELAAVTRDMEPWGSAWRQRDYELLVSDRFKSALKQNDVHVIDWRSLRRWQQRC
jgi:chitin disaccharide deacetylase